MQNVRGKSRKLRSGFCEVGYCRKLLQAWRLHLEISGFYSERWLIKVINSRNLSGLIYRKLCDIWIKVSLEALLVSLFPAVYLLKTLVERLNTVYDGIRS